MLSFLSKRPMRTKTSHLSRLTLDDGRSSAIFKAPSDHYLVINRLPPAASASASADGASDDGGEHNGVGVVAQRQAGSNSSLAPPLHWHRAQQEVFHVLEGTARFTIGGEEQTADRGDVVVVPTGAVHTFWNASDQTELVVEFLLDPSARERDEAYFRNVWNYRDDCRKAGMKRSIFQALLFMHRGGVVMALPGPLAISKRLGVMFNVVGGLIIGKQLNLDTKAANDASLWAGQRLRPMIVNPLVSKLAMQAHVTGLNGRDHDTLRPPELLTPGHIVDSALVTSRWTARCARNIDPTSKHRVA